MSNRSRKQARIELTKLIQEREELFVFSVNDYLSYA